MNPFFIPQTIKDVKLFMSHLPIFVVQQGNTAVYLLYAHARICSIIRKSGRDIEEVKKVSLFSP
jgi:hypothetical protein